VIARPLPCGAAVRGVRLRAKLASACMPRSLNSGNRSRCLSPAQLRRRAPYLARSLRACPEATRATWRLPFQPLNGFLRQVALPVGCEQFLSRHPARIPARQETAGSGSRFAAAPREEAGPAKRQLSGARCPLGLRVVKISRLDSGCWQAAQRRKLPDLRPVPAGTPRKCAGGHAQQRQARAREVTETAPQNSRGSHCSRSMEQTTGLGLAFSADLSSTCRLRTASSTASRRHRDDGGTRCCVRVVSQQFLPAADCSPAACLRERPPGFGGVRLQHHPTLGLASLTRRWHAWTSDQLRPAGSWPPRDRPPAATCRGNSQ